MSVNLHKDIIERFTYSILSLSVQAKYRIAVEIVILQKLFNVTLSDLSVNSHQSGC